jgi:Cu+-exporting ATPase
VAGLAAWSAHAFGGSWVDALWTACAVVVSLSPVGADVLADALWQRGHRVGESEGFRLKDAIALQELARVERALVWSSGALVLGDPEIVLVEAFGSTDEGRVLSLAGSAWIAAGMASASAFEAAMQGRRTATVGFSRIQSKDGHGVRATLVSGETLVVGSKAFVLKEYVSVATADARMNELEAMGRAVVVVALDGRLLGLVAMQDALMTGARAAIEGIQNLGIEPILLSGDARGTVEALARAVDAEQVRPELERDDVPATVRSLTDGEASAVGIARWEADGGLLSVMPCAIAIRPEPLPTAPSNPPMAMVEDVRKAMACLRLARETRAETQRVAVTLLAVPLVAAGAVMAQLAPISMLPLAALGAIGGFTVAVARRSARKN